MKKLLVKICGLMREEDVDHCINSGADIVGFVVDYPVAVPWNLDKKRAGELINHFRKKTEETGIKCECCIVSGGSIEKLSNLISVLKPDYIQLHYKEDEDTIIGLKKLHSIKIIKTVPEGSDDAKAFEKAGADILLVDARNAENAASSGYSLNEEFYKNVRASVDIPVMAAGGINPSNVKDIIDRLSPELIDIMTGVEESFGIKSQKKINDLMDNIKDYI